MRYLFGLLFILMLMHSSNAQQRISKDELDFLKKNSKERPLLQNDNDFESSPDPSKWSSESAVILCQKTSFDFDKKGLSVGKRIGRNVTGVLFALPTLGTSLILANMNNETKIMVEEMERRKILLKDKFAIEQYSVLYFRLASEGDAFAARVIKKNGSRQELDLSDAIKIEDIRSVPGIFRSYTDGAISTTYRPIFFKLAVSDLEEGDIIEYEFRNYNVQKFYHNPSYMEFDPVYFLCNRELPVAKQIIEVATQDDRYHIGYKSLKGAPAFVPQTKDGKKIYRWEDVNREKMVDTRFVNDYMELPSVKFQMIYARNSGKNFIWSNDESNNSRDLTIDELAEKSKTFWYSPEKLQTTGDYTAGLKTNIESTVDNIYKSLKKRGAADGDEGEYIRKAYYAIRAQTMYSPWSDYAFAKVLSGLLSKKKIQHDILVSTSNTRTKLDKVAFTQEIAWVVRYKNRYYANPGEHGNPEELPARLSGNPTLVFSATDIKAKAVQDVMPLRDTFDNILTTSLKVSVDPALATNLVVEKAVEAKGLVKDDLIDEIITLTPYMEVDFRNYDAMSMWEGLSAREEEKATSLFNDQKKEWKEEKPKMMKAVAESEYGVNVENYTGFKLQQDGRNHKKRSLRYTENFVLGDLTARAGQDLVIALPTLVGKQPKISKEERNRTLPVDMRYPRVMSWTISFAIPAGYTAQGLEALNKTVSNNAGSFLSVAKVENNNVVLQVRKVYLVKNMEAGEWNNVTQILDAAYEFSQSKLVLQKL